MSLLLRSTFFRHYMAKSMQTQVITQHLSLKLLALNCGFNILRSSGKDFHQVLEPGCRDFLPLSHKSISGVSH